MAIRVKDGQHYVQAQASKKRFVRHDPNLKALERAEEMEENDEMTVEVRFSSDAEVDMWYGTEILEHNAEAVNLERFNSGRCPVMKDHRWDSDSQLAVIESARIDEHYGYATIRFSDSEQGKQYYRDLIRGIRDCFSVGYDVHEWEIKDADTDDLMYIATRWTPREISFTPFPADDTAQAMRSERSDVMFQLEEAHMKEERDEEQTEETEEPEAETPDATETPEASAAEESSEERAQVNPSDTDKDKTRDARMILKLCKDLEQLDTERGLQAIRDGKNFETFQSEVIDEFVNVRLNAESGDLEVDESARFTGTDVDPKDIREFRLLNLVAGAGNEDGQLGGREREICEEERQRRKDVGIETQGYAIPGAITGSISEYRARKAQQAIKQARSLTFSTDTEGGHLVDEKLLVENFIDILYANHPVSGAANWITDVHGTLAIPKQDGRVVVNWTTETGDASESTPSFELLQFSPKELRAMVIWSRTFAMISSIDAENFARRNLMRQTGETADEQLLYGDGTNNSIEGVSQIAAIKDSPNAQRTRYSQADGVTYKNCIDSMASIGNANAMGPMAKWILSWGFWRQVMTTTRLSHGDVAILDDMGMIAGFMAEATSQCKSTVGTDTDRDQALFANWEHLLVPMWGGIDIFVDPNTLLERGEIRVVSFMRIDTGIAHDEAFQLLERTP